MIAIDPDIAFLGIVVILAVVALALGGRRPDSPADPRPPNGTAW
jgi:hypothetical protein